MNQQQLDLFRKPPRKSVRQDAAKIIEPKLNDTQCGFVAAVALQKKFLLTRKFSKNLGSMPKIYTHVLSTSEKYMAGCLLKIFG